MSRSKHELIIPFLYSCELFSTDSCKSFQADTLEYIPQLTEVSLSIVKLVKKLLMTRSIFVVDTFHDLCIYFSGIRLQCKSQTTCTAIVYFHKLTIKHPDLIKSYDKYVSLVYSMYNGIYI